MTYTRPISINWGTAGVELWLTVQADAAGGTILRARASIGTTEAGGNLLADVAGWDTAWQGYAVIDDGSARVAQAIDGVGQQANAGAALAAVGLDAAGVSDLQDKSAVAAAQSTTAAAQATVAAAGVAGIVAGTSVVRADNRAGALIEADSSGAGARTVVITVDDGAEVIEGARVRVSRGVESHVMGTDGGGEARFNLDEGTWAVGVTRSGYSFGGAELEVDGDKTVRYSMEAVVIVPAAEVWQTTGWLVTYDGRGEVAAGKVVYFQLVETAEGAAGRSFARGVFGAVSDEGGLLQVALVRGARYVAWRDRVVGGRTEFVAGDGGTFALPEVLGAAAE